MRLEAACDEDVVEARTTIRPRDEGVLSDPAATTLVAFAIARHGTTLSSAIWRREFLAIDPRKILAALYKSASTRGFSRKLSSTTRHHQRPFAKNSRSTIAAGSVMPWLTFHRPSPPSRARTSRTPAGPTSPLLTTAASAVAVVDPAASARRAAERGGAAAAAASRSPAVHTDSA